eukprot:COSAG05_NODE_248_length_12946_cov_85.003737_2_plen_151_part_00
MDEPDGPSRERQATFPQQGHLRLHRVQHTPENLNTRSKCLQHNMAQNEARCIDQQLTAIPIDPKSKTAPVASPIALPPEHPEIARPTKLKRIIVRSTRSMQVSSTCNTIASETIYTSMQSSCSSAHLRHFSARQTLAKPPRRRPLPVFQT